MILVFSIIAFCLFTAMVGFNIGFYFRANANKTLREDLEKAIKHEIRLTEQIGDLHRVNNEWQTRYENLRRDKRF